MLHTTERVLLWDLFPIIQKEKIRTHDLLIKGHELSHCHRQLFYALHHN